MLSRCLPMLFASLVTCIHADLIQVSPTSTSAFFLNISTTASGSSFSYETPSVCCFVIQETATENYWPIESILEITQSFNLFSITSYVTPYKNGTVISVETNIIKTSTITTTTIDRGVNPISFYDNPVPPIPDQTWNEELLGVTAVVTGGVTVHSPSAFLVYSTLKIITAAPVTNADGFVQCGTRSSWDGPGPDGAFLPTWANINSNAEAYFGGYGLAGDTQEPTDTMMVTTTGTSDGNFYTSTTVMNLNTTYYTNSDGETVRPVPASTGIAAEITLIEPFIFFPTQGLNGATLSTSCFQADETELYGYVPQTLVDDMAQDRGYLAQYPDLASCLPGGPSILRRQGCTGGGYNFSFVYQTPEAGDLSRTTVITVTPPPIDLVPSSLATAQTLVQITDAGGNHIDGATGVASTATPTDGGGGLPEESSNFNSLADGGDPPFTRQGGGDQRPPQTSLGAIINSILGGDSGNGGQNSGPLSTSIISGTPVFVVPNPTTVPAAGLPVGLGSTTIIDGTPFVVIQPTTVPIPGGIPPFSTTIINGVPFLVIPGPMTIPVAGAPSGLIGSITTINGTPFLIIPAATSVPVLPGQVTVIDGTTFDVFTGITTVPVDPELSLVGITTVISGTTMVILPGATTVAVAPASSTFVQASSAGRGMVSWIGFGLKLVRGFVLRFR